MPGNPHEQLRHHLAAHRAALHAKRAHGNDQARHHAARRDAAAGAELLAASGVPDDGAAAGNASTPTQPAAEGV